LSAASMYELPTQTPGDLYELFEIEPWFTPCELEQARHRLMLELHMGVGRGRDEWVSRVNVGYQILSSPTLRLSYDASDRARCPYCMHPMPKAAIDWQHLRLHGGVERDEPRACAICRRLPTARFTFRAVAPLDAEVGMYEFEGPLCRACSLQLQVGFQEANFAHGKPIRRLLPAVRSLVQNRFQARSRHGLPFAVMAGVAHSPREEFWLQVVGYSVMAAGLVLLFIGLLTALSFDEAKARLALLQWWAPGVVLLFLGAWIKHPRGP
jgi:hypothetical protein